MVIVEVQFRVYAGIIILVIIMYCSCVNICVCFIIFFCPFFCLFRAASTANRSSQARGRIGTVAASLHHCHSNIGSELRLRPTQQLDP